jgi:hypothetical protein
MMTGQYERVYWRGAPMTARQRQAFIATEKAIRKRYRFFRFRVLQGSWQPASPWSGSSHTGAGVVDLAYWGIGSSSLAAMDKYRFVLRALREVGRQAAFGRGPWNAQLDGSGGMPLHYHTCDLDTKGEASTVATFQVPQYKLGFDGLVAGVPDKFPFRPDPIVPWRFV